MNVSSMIPFILFLLSMPHATFFSTSKSDELSPVDLLRGLVTYTLSLRGGSDHWARKRGLEAASGLPGEQEEVGSKRAREAGEVVEDAGVGKDALPDHLLALDDEEMEEDLLVQLSSSSGDGAEPAMYHDPFDEEVHPNFDAPEVKGLDWNSSVKKQSQIWKKRRQSRVRSAEETGFSDHSNTSDLHRNYGLTALSPPLSNVSLSESSTSSWDPFGPDDECQDVQVEDEDGRVRNVTRVKIGNLKEIPEFGELDSEHVYNEHNSSLLLLQGGWNRTGAVIHVPCVKAKGTGRTGLPTWASLQEVLDRAGGGAGKVEVAKGETLRIRLHQGEHVCHKDVVVWPRSKLQLFGEDSRVIGRWIVREGSRGYFTSVTFVSIESLLDSFRPCLLLTFGGEKEEKEEVLTRGVRWNFSFCSLLSGYGDSIVCVGSQSVQHVVEEEKEMQEQEQEQEQEQDERPGLLLSLCFIGGIDEQHLKCADGIFLKGDVKCIIEACTLGFSGHLNGSAIVCSHRAQLRMTGSTLQDNSCSLLLTSFSKARATECKLVRAERHLRVDSSSSLQLLRCSIDARAGERSTDAAATLMEEDTGGGGGGGGGGGSWLGVSSHVERVRRKDERREEGDCSGHLHGSQGQKGNMAECCQLSPPCPHAQLDELIARLLLGVPDRKRHYLLQAVQDFKSRPPKIDEDCFATRVCKIAKRYKEELVAPLQSLFASFFFHPS